MVIIHNKVVYSGCVITNQWGSAKDVVIAEAESLVIQGLTKRKSLFLYHYPNQ
jgi:hypothetical protein